jgi:hypothetical protein
MTLLFLLIYLVVQRRSGELIQPFQDNNDEDSIMETSSGTLIELQKRVCDKWGEYYGIDKWCSYGHEIKAKQHAVMANLANIVQGNEVGENRTVSKLRGPRIEEIASKK